MPHQARVETECSYRCNVSNDTDKHFLIYAVSESALRDRNEAFVAIDSRSHDIVPYYSQVTPCNTITEQATQRSFNIDILKCAFASDTVDPKQISNNHLEKHTSKFNAMQRLVILR